MLQKDLTGARSCTGGDRSPLLFHFHSQNAPCSGARAWHLLRAQPGGHHQQPSGMVGGGILRVWQRGCAYTPLVPPKAFSQESGLERGEDGMLEGLLGAKHKPPSPHDII